MTGNRDRFKRRRLILAGVLLAAGVIGERGLRHAAYYAGAARHAHVSLEPGNAPVPKVRTLAWQRQSQITDHILNHWAAKPLPDWRVHGKTEAPRILMCRFMLKHNLDLTNAYLAEAKPWGRAGSTWARHPEGDYDFTLTGLTPILFLFGDDPAVLYPQTLDHLLTVLMTEEGGKPLVKVPRTMGLVRDTENHLLMTEGSRYLKNRWLALHGSIDPAHANGSNGLEDWLLDLLEELRTAGLYEFNSIPYEGYTLTALLNLEAFGSQEVQQAARDVIDRMNWNYALGSLSFRRFPPFRRQYEHADDTALDGDRHTELMVAWVSLRPGSTTEASAPEGGIAPWACWAPYRLPDETLRWTLAKPREYFVKIGHGPGGSPEIYSGGSGYLLSAGGVNRGGRSYLVARPTTLLLDDGATDLSDIVHLAGPGETFREWNNTGVSQDFAVAGGPVHVPEGWRPDAVGALWSVYQREPNLCVAVHSRVDLGIVHVVRSSEPKAVLISIANANGDAIQLKHSFRHSVGWRIRYDTKATHNRWVIRSVDDEPVDRRFDHWPMLEGAGIAPSI